MSNFFRGIISKENSNTKRQIEIDLVRGLAVLFMILVHTSNEFLDESYNNTIFAKVIDFFGCIPAAPVFMFVMGVGFVYSKNQNPRNLFKRGLAIFAGGYVLNFFRGFLPQIIGNKLGYYQISFDQSKEYLLAVDILQFAGLAMLFVSLLKFLRISQMFYPLVALVTGIVSPHLWGITSTNPILKTLFMALFGGKVNTFHPLFSWIYYPLMGAFFGMLLIRVKSIEKFYLVSGIVSISITCATLVYYFTHPGNDLGIVSGKVYNYYHHGILSNIMFCSAVVWWLSVWHFISGLLPRFLKERLMFWSKTVTVIYVIHWLIIGWCGYLVFDLYNIWQTIIIMVILIFTTDRLADLYIKIRERLSEREEVDIPVTLKTTHLDE